MRVEFGLFDGDDLLHKGALDISDVIASKDYGDLMITHQLEADAAKIIIEVYEEEDRLIRSTLEMPIHESEDWESIELARFTLAFKCKLNS